MAVYEEKESYAASRSGGLGGTDVAAILGLSQWKRPIDVYESKVHPERIPELEKECLWWGNELEPIVRRRYAAQHDIIVVDPHGIEAIFPETRRWRDTYLVIGSEPWMIGAPDGWIPSTGRGLEIKTAAFKRSDEWGDEDSDEVPANYFAQVAWYMAVTDAKGWDFGVLFSGNTLTRYRVERDMQMEHDIIETARWFWNDCILKRSEPPIDQTESYGRYLARKFSLSTGNVIKNPSIELVEWALKMKAADDEETAAADRKREANNHLRALVGDAQKAMTPIGSIGWIRPEEKQVTDWTAVATQLSSLYDEARAGDAVTAAEIVAKHTAPKRNESYLRAWWKK